MDTKGSTTLIFIFLAAGVGTLTMAYFFVPPSWQFSILAGSASLVLLAGCCLLWLLFSRFHRLLRQYRAVRKQLQTATISILKEGYEQLYNGYMQLSEHQKQAFYPLLMQLRENLEQQLVAEKELQSLLKKTPSAMSDKKKQVDQLIELLHQLPQKSQTEYYPQVMQAKERVEGGR